MHLEVSSHLSEGYLSASAANASKHTTTHRDRVSENIVAVMPAFHVVEVGP